MLFKFFKCTDSESVVGRACAMMSPGLYAHHDFLWGPGTEFLTLSVCVSVKCNCCGTKEQVTSLAQSCSNDDMTTMMKTRKMTKTGRKRLLEAVRWEAPCWCQCAFSQKKASKMAQLVKVLTTKPEDLSSISRTRIAEVENSWFPEAVLWLPHVLCTVAHTPTTWNK